ncbi:DEAD/DEAH box helicase [Cellulosimicrobium cellulans]
MRLEDIAPGTRIDGLDALPVLVVGVEWHGTDALSVVYRSSSGVLAEQIVYRADEASLRAADESLRWSFDADGARFKLAAEATRIRIAGLFDPMLAVTSSAIDPLPHQISAVYGEMLPRPGPLRFLLADDPGAGKTIMAGLYLKELILRGDVARALIVAPGGLVEQSQDELASKFGLEFEIRSRSLAEADLHGDPFASSPLLIARMDQLSHDEEWMRLLAETQWDLAIVDEAHRMSAHFYGNELTRTRRYELGQLLGTITRHYLLMTATPHAGKEEDFQLFLALLDPDRFDGRYRAGAHSTDTSGLMRRMIKEDLLTFEGKPLFPERVAETVSYTLSGLEMSLYEQVTEYVRTEMNRAERIEAEGRSGRARTVGFALTVLQRRLASSPEAIYRSPQRRSARLQRRRDEMMALGSPAERSLALGWAEALDDGARQHTTRLTSAAADLELDGSFDEDELDARELEDLEEEVIDAATAARTAAELEVEIAVLADLERLAAQVRASGVDRHRPTDPRDRTQGPADQRPNAHCPRPAGRRRREHSSARGRTGGSTARPATASWLPNAAPMPSACGSRSQSAPRTRGHPRCLDEVGAEPPESFGQLLDRFSELPALVWTGDGDPTEVLDVRDPLGRWARKARSALQALQDYTLEHLAGRAHTVDD